MQTDATERNGNYNVFTLTISEYGEIAPFLSDSGNFRNHFHNY